MLYLHGENYLQLSSIPYLAGAGSPDEVFGSFCPTPPIEAVLVTLDEFRIDGWYGHEDVDTAGLVRGHRAQ